MNNEAEGSRNSNVERIHSTLKALGLEDETKKFLKALGLEDGETKKLTRLECDALARVLIWTESCLSGVGRKWHCDGGRKATGVDRERLVHKLEAAGKKLYKAINAGWKGLDSPMP